MEQYIKKSILVTEIERLIAELVKEGEDTMFEQGRISAFEDVKLFIDTIKVKEVDDIWHDVSEKPELEQPLLIIMKGTHKDFRRHYRIGCYGKRANDIPTWVINGCYSDSFISKWCYISDILKQTFEAKEVDLEKEISNWWDNHYHKKFYKLEGYTGHYTENSTILDIAKHFFELGLKAQKGE